MKRFAVATLAALACAAPSTHAQTYPSKPVRIIIPFAAGGPADFLMRTVAPKLSESWGQPVIIDNRGGENQAIGSELAARAPADSSSMHPRAAVHRAISRPDVRERMQNQGMDPTTNTPEEFSAYLRSEILKWAEVVKASGAKPE